MFIKTSNLHEQFETSSKECRQNQATAVYDKYMRIATFANDAAGV